VFDAPRRPDLIKFYLLETKRRRALNKPPNIKDIKNNVLFLKSYAPPCSFFSKSGLKENHFRTLPQNYHCIRMSKNEFFIPSSNNGLLDLSNIYYKESDSLESKKVINKNISKGIKQQYRELDFTVSSAGDLFNGKRPLVKILRTYFIRVVKEYPKYELDFSEVYCLDQDTKTVFKCKPEVVAPKPLKPNLRFLKDGRVFLGDEITAPTFLELNEEWSTEEATCNEITARAKRSSQHIGSKLRHELSLDTQDWRGANLVSKTENFSAGGENARRLEALGRYKAKTTDGYGDVWLNKTQKDLEKYIANRENENQLVAMTGLRNPWVDLGKMIKEKERQFRIQKKRASNSK
jgi:hypothetical protein